MYSSFESFEKTGKVQEAQDSNTTTKLVTEIGKEGKSTLEKQGLKEIIMETNKKEEPQQ